MGVFGAIPEAVCQAITAGHAGAVTVEVAGTLMSFVPDTTHDAAQTWWTRLGVFVESEGLVTSRHSPSHQRDEPSPHLNRLRFTDYLPGAKVLVWPTAYRTFIYVKQGLGKGEAKEAVRLALKAANRRPLGTMHSTVIGLGVAGGMHLPMWVAHWPLPKGALHAAGASLALAAVAGASGLVFQWPAPDTEPPAAVSPVTAQSLSPPNVAPMRHYRSRSSSEPSSFVQADPTITPRLVPASPSASRTTPPAPTPAPTPTPVPAPLPSTQVPNPLPSSVVSDTPTSWWLPSRPPF